MGVYELLLVFWSQAFEAIGSVNCLSLLCGRQLQRHELPAAQSSESTARETSSWPIGVIWVSSEILAIKQTRSFSAETSC